MHSESSKLRAKIRSYYDASKIFEDDSELVVRDKISYLQQSVKEQTNATAAAIQRMQFVLDNLHDMIVRLRSRKGGEESSCVLAIDKSKSQVHCSSVANEDVYSSKWRLKRIGMSTSYTLLSFYGDFFMNTRAGVELSIVPSNSALNVEHEWIVTASPRRACALSYGEGWKQSGSACVFEDAEKVIGENGLPKRYFQVASSRQQLWGAHARGSEQTLRSEHVYSNWHVGNFSTSIEGSKVYVSESRGKLLNCDGRIVNSKTSSDVWFFTSSKDGNALKYDAVCSNARAQATSRIPTAWYVERRLDNSYLIHDFEKKSFLDYNIFHDDGIASFSQGKKSARAWDIEPPLERDYLVDETSSPERMCPSGDLCP